MKVRIKFSKKGVMKYIGHLDIMRYFQKCIRRADVDIAYSTGYSPHQIMSFASPLGVGIESNGEYFDIELLSGHSNEIKESLNRVMVDGMEIISVRKLPDGVKNAMASIAAASYTISMKENFKQENLCDNKINDFLSQNEIIMIKQTKKNKQTENPHKRVSAKTISHRHYWSNSCAVHKFFSFLKFLYLLLQLIENVLK